MKLVVAFHNIPSNLRSAPAVELRSVAVTTLIGVIGIVPSVLSLYGQDDFASIVSIIVGSLSVAIAISSVMFKYWVVSN